MLSVSFETGGGEVLDRIIEAYGFTSKIDYCNHLNVSASSLSMRYKRNIFPSDLAIRCIAETGVNLEWLVTGAGRKFDNEQLDVLKLRKKKLVDGQLFDANYLMFDKAFFLPSQPPMKEPQVILDGEIQYIVDCKFTEVYDGKWLVDIEGKISIRDLTRIPIRRVRVGGVGVAFDCELEDIKVLGRIVMTCS